MSHDPGAGAIGLQLVDMATRGVASGATASAAVNALVPVGAEEVSAQAAAFAAEGAAVLALHAAAQEEIARAGVALTDIARMYSQVDTEVAGTLTTAGAQFSGQPFAGGAGAGVGAGMLRGDAARCGWVGGPHTTYGQVDRRGRSDDTYDDGAGRRGIRWRGSGGAGRRGRRVNRARFRHRPAELPRLARPGCGGRCCRAEPGLLADREPG